MKMKIALAVGVVVLVGTVSPAAVAGQPPPEGEGVSETIDGTLTTAEDLILFLLTYDPALLPLILDTIDEAIRTAEAALEEAVSTAEELIEFLLTYDPALVEEIAETLEELSCHPEGLICAPTWFPEATVEDRAEQALEPGTAACRTLMEELTGSPEACPPPGADL